MNIKLVKYSDGDRPYILCLVKKHYKGKSYIRRIYGVVANCYSCGIEFFTRSRKDYRPMKFCSKKCTRHLTRLKHFKIGAVIKRHGHLKILLPNHPEADSQGRVWVHRIKVEKSIGRRLKEGEVVHHKDGNKENNNIKNLQIMTAYDHAMLHFSEKWTKTKSWYKDKNNYEKVVKK